jgi:aminopeptidase N
MKRILPFLLLLASNTFAYNRQDTLRGSNGSGRDWWDVLKYDLVIDINTASHSIRGSNTMTIKITGEPRDSMQLDLQEGMNLVPQKDPDGNTYTWPREGNVYWLDKGKQAWQKGKTYTIRFDFEGKPRNAVNPPWDGGFIWTKDSTGKPWTAVACQGLGASSWWPCKDYQGDEPDSGVTVMFTINRASPILSQEEKKDTTLACISNGRGNTRYFEDPVTQHVYGEHTFTVRNPINTYDVTFYIGNYAHWHDTLHGEKGILDLDFYPLRYNEAKARKQWTQAKEMLRCFEYWMGPYPFYEDGYKLVEAPYLGMEHQSAVAYGNQYKNGYNGRSMHIDRSGTGVGFSFDFIIIHESGHEWFGNSITAQDMADNWLHEGFTTYTETLFAEWIKGKDSAFAYVTGQQQNIRNDRPVIGDYSVNNEGSSDMYDKGAQIVHMIRMMIDDDKKFRQLMRGLNKDFYHKIVTSTQVEHYISRFVGRDMKPFFDTYLRSTVKPVLHWHDDNGHLSFEWKGVPTGFVAPFIIQRASGKSTFTDIPKDYSYPLYRSYHPRPVVKACGWYDVVEDE